MDFRGSDKRKIHTEIHTPVVPAVSKRRRKAPVLRRARTSGSVTFVGMWHTHPKALPIPSRTDLGAMKQLLSDRETFQGRSFLMLIVGGTSKRPIVSAGLFERGDYDQA